MPQEAGYLPAMAQKATPLYRFIAGLSRPVLRLVFHYEVLGRENLPAGGFVLAAGLVTILEVGQQTVVLPK